MDAYKIPFLSHDFLPPFEDDSEQKTAQTNNTENLSS